MNKGKIMTDTVLVSRDTLQRLLDYVEEMEYNSFLEYIEEYGSGEGHIYSVLNDIQLCVDSQ
jgi:hypothetical protein